MLASIRIAALLLVVGTLVLAAPKGGPEEVEMSPHAAALELVFRKEKSRLRELEKGDWWHDVEERSWVAKRPFMPGTIDSTHLFHVSYRIGGKEVAAWLVDAAKGDVRPATVGRDKTP